MKKNVAKFVPLARRYLFAEWKSEVITNGGKLTCDIDRFCAIEIYFDLDQANQVDPASVVTRIAQFGGEYDIRKWKSLEDGLQHIKDYLSSRLKDVAYVLEGSGGCEPLSKPNQSKTMVCDLGDVVFRVQLDGAGSGVIQTEFPSDDEDASTDGEADSEFNAAINVLGSVVLAQACAGIDISTKQYAESIQTVVDAILNQYD